MNNGFKEIDYEHNYKNYNTDKETLFISNNEDSNKLEMVLENYNPKIEYATFRLVIFIFQYLHTFEDKSINTIFVNEKNGPEIIEIGIIENKNKDVIVILTPGKVGSSSVYKSLKSEFSNSSKIT